MALIALNVSLRLSCLLQGLLYLYLSMPQLLMAWNIAEVQTPLNSEECNCDLEILLACMRYSSSTLLTTGQRSFSSWQVWHNIKLYRSTVGKSTNSCACKTFWILQNGDGEELIMVGRHYGLLYQKPINHAINFLHCKKNFKKGALDNSNAWELPWSALLCVSAKENANNL